MDSADLVKSLLGLVTGAIGTYIGLYWKIRGDLTAKYDEELRTERIKYYMLLWKVTEPLAKYAPPGPLTIDALHQLAVALRQWYFSGGGMFLSDRARVAYFALQDSIAAESNTPGDHTSDSTAPTERVQAIRDASSRLRTVLTADAGSRKKPVLEGPGEA